MRGWLHSYLVLRQPRQDLLASPWFWRSWSRCVAAAPAALIRQHGCASCLQCTEQQEMDRARVFEVWVAQIVLQVIESNVKRGSSVYEQDHVSSYSTFCYMHVWCMVPEVQDPNVALHAHMLHRVRYADLGAGMGRQP